MKLILFILTIASIAGCVSAPPAANVGPSGAFSTPNIGETSIAGVGDNLIRQGVGYEADCIVPSFNHHETFGLGSILVTIEAGRPLCERDYEGYYWPQYETVAAGYSKMRHWVELKPQGAAVKYCVAGTYCLERADNDFSQTRKVVPLDDSIEQTIEYMGKSGEVLDFTYAEFVNGLARDSFTRAFTVDLNETRTLSFKGVEIEIISASATEISYKLASRFR